MKDVAGARGVHDSSAPRGEAPETPPVEVQPAPFAECDDRRAPVLSRDLAHHAPGVARAPRRGELARHDREVDVGEQTQDGGAGAVEVTDHARADTARAPDRTQRLLGEVTVDHQHRAANDRRQVEVGCFAFERAAIWHDEPALAGLLLAENHGDRRFGLG